MRVILIARVAAVLAFLVAFSPSSPSSGFDGDLIWGVNGHPFTAYPGLSASQQLRYVEDLGMSSYRVNIRDGASAPGLRVLVEEAARRGIDILPVITPDYLDLASLEPEELYRETFAIASALVSEFKDDIRVWELGNEMENYAIIQPCEMRDDGSQYPCEWGPAGGVSPLDYYGPRWEKVSAVLKGLSDGAAAADSTALRAMGTAGWGHVGAFRRMRADGIEWDISVWHMYGQDPEWAFEILQEFDRPIWVTEFNHPFGSRDGESAQMQGLKDQIAQLRRLRTRYRVEAAHIYELFDEPYWGEHYEAVMGLVRLVEGPDGSWKPGAPKPAYGAVRGLIRSDDVASPPLDCDLRPFRLMPPAHPTQIAYAYCLVLGRAPDGAGMRGWAASRQGGMSAAEMVLGMLSSDEFRDRHATFGLSDRAFLAMIHRLLLGQESQADGLPDEAESNLDGVGESRRAAVERIVASKEFRQVHPMLFADPAPAPRRSTEPE
jgi:hypothetical protein